MSLVGRQRGDTRRRFDLTFGALLAAFAIAAPAPSRAAAGIEQSRDAVRYVVEPRERQVAVAKSPAKKATGGAAPKGWLIYENGATDPRGDFHSSKRLRRRILEKPFGVETGRQWVRVNCGLRERAPQIAAMPLQEFVQYVFWVATKTGVPFAL